MRELMTEDPERVSADAAVGDVHERLIDEGYTAARVARDDPPQLYVTRADLDEALPGASDDPVYKHAERVGLEDLVASDAEFGDLITELAETLDALREWSDRETGKRPVGQVGD